MEAAFFGALGIPIDVEGDSLAQEGEIHCMAAVLKLLGRKLLEQAVKTPIMGAGHALLIQHFIETTVMLVILKHGSIEAEFYPLWPF